MITNKAPQLPTLCLYGFFRDTAEHDEKGSQLESDQRQAQPNGTISYPRATTRQQLGGPSADISGRTNSSSSLPLNGSGNTRLRTVELDLFNELPRKGQRFRDQPAAPICRPS